MTRPGLGHVDEPAFRLWANLRFSRGLRADLMKMRADGELSVFGEGSQRRSLLGHKIPGGVKPVRIPSREKQTAGSVGLGQILERSGTRRDGGRRSRSEGVALARTTH